MSKESASQISRLPTVSEIEAATERLSMSDAYDQVFRVGEHFTVKSGYGVPLIEAETMKFLEDNQVPVPKVHAAFKDPKSKKIYIIMDHVPGDTPESLLPSLDPNEKATICKLIKDAICKLRSIPSPDYFGMLNREPYLDEVFWTADYDPKIFGPFANQEDLSLAIIETSSDGERAVYSIVATYD
ncbi:hypothetical protein AbraIFM66950_003917 [Aspergillus brasiliensis]|nr:hypothetical protein AbraIFM66950_003917 [Aspergillus brasiliensis]